MWNALPVCSSCACAQYKQTRDPLTNTGLHSAISGQKLQAKKGKLAKVGKQPEYQTMWEVITRNISLKSSADFNPRDWTECQFYKVFKDWAVLVLFKSIHLNFIFWNTDSPISSWRYPRLVPLAVTLTENSNNSVPTVSFCTFFTEDLFLATLKSNTFKNCCAVWDTSLPGQHESWWHCAKGFCITSQRFV